MMIQQAEHIFDKNSSLVHAGREGKDVFDVFVELLLHREVKPIQEGLDPL